VEDWEQFFIEKSHRRFDRERNERRRQRTRTTIAASLFVLLIVGGLSGLAVFA
jgi:hypothetical protein